MLVLLLVAVTATLAATLRGARSLQGCAEFVPKVQQSPYDSAATVARAPGRRPGGPTVPPARRNARDTRSPCSSRSSLALAASLPRRPAPPTACGSASTTTPPSAGRTSGWTSSTRRRRRIGTNIVRDPRRVAPGREDEARQPDEQLRPRLRVHRDRRAGPERAGTRDGDRSCRSGARPHGRTGRQAEHPAARTSKDFADFAKAVASRYSGKRAGYPFVRFYGIWNESNISLFLSPQYDAEREDRRPRRVREAREGRRPGDQGGEPEAPGGDRRDVLDRTRQAEGRHRQRLRRARHLRAAARARASRALKFDAWAQHPYPFPVNMKPSQKVRVPERDAALPAPLRGRPRQVVRAARTCRSGSPSTGTRRSRASRRASPSPSRPGTRRRRSSSPARTPRVEMFVWFVFRDSNGQPLAERACTGRTGRWPGAADVGRRPPRGRSTCGTDASRLKAGTKNPPITVYLREFCANNAVGATVGTTTRVYDGTEARRRDPGRARSWPPTAR